MVEWRVEPDKVQHGSVHSFVEHTWYCMPRKLIFVLSTFHHRSFFGLCLAAVLSVYS